MKQHSLFLAVLLAATPALAQVDCNQGMEPIDSTAESRLSANEFVQIAAAKEQTFVKAFATYGYIIDLTVQTVQGDTVDGEFHQVTTFGFDASGTRRAVVTTGPVNTLSRLTLSDKDINGFNDMLPFALTPSNLADLDVVYSGRQKMGEINTSVFDALARDSPAAPSPRLQARAWVHPRGNVIIKTCSRGRTSPIAQLRYDSMRQEVGGEYWFPALLRADEEAEIGGAKVHVRVTVKYSDYQAHP
ncbi:MAG: hypothetical protein ACHQK9_11860 [Reyranellales bacterium]